MQQSCGLTVRVYRNFKDIEDLRGLWSTWPGTRDSDMDVFLAACRVSSDVLSPCVFVVYRDGKPSALFAGSVHRRRFPLRVGWLTIFKPMANVMVFPYGALRGDACEENCAALVHELLGCLRNGEGHLAFIEQVSNDSSIYRCANSVPGFFCRDHLAAVRPHRQRRLPGSSEEFYSGLSSHKRKDFRQIFKQVARDFSGQVRVDRCDSPAGLDRALQVVEEIASKTWQRQFGGGFTAADVSLTELLRTEAKNGWLRVYTLYVGQKPCAFWIGAVYQGTFYNDFVGYDPAYARYSPGTYLFLRIVEELCSSGVKEIDFGFSDEEYKKRFANWTWQGSNVYLYAPTRRGVTLSAMKLITTSLNESARYLLERANLIQRVKRVWRRLRITQTGSSKSKLAGSPRTSVLSESKPS